MPSFWTENPRTDAALLAKQNEAQSRNAQDTTCAGTNFQMMTYVGGISIACIFVSSMMSPMYSDDMAHYRVTINTGFIITALLMLKNLPATRGTCFDKQFGVMHILVLIVASAIVLALKQKEHTWYVDMGQFQIDLTVVAVAIMYFMYFALLSEWSGGLGMMRVLKKHIMPSKANSEAANARIKNQQN